jgi:hypothetical protein
VQRIVYLEDVDDDADNDDHGGQQLGIIPTDEEYGDKFMDPCPDVDGVETSDRYLNAEFIVAIVVMSRFKQEW